MCQAQNTGNKLGTFWIQFTCWEVLLQALAAAFAFACCLLRFAFRNNAAYCTHGYANGVYYCPFFDVGPLIRKAPRRISSVCSCSGKS
jgi:hypothetical protein